MYGVRVITVRYLIDDVYEGSIPREAYENARDEYVPVDDVDEAVRYIQSLGLTFAATGNVWAADPDGSRTVDYATGEEEEVTAHLCGFHAVDESIIAERVG